MLTGVLMLGFDIYMWYCVIAPIELVPNCPLWGFDPVWIVGNCVGARGVRM